MSWRDRKNSQVAADEPKPQYPFIQWANRPEDINPRPKKGGPYITSANAQQLNGSPAGFRSAEAYFDHGAKIEDILFGESLTVAIIKTRFAWVTKDGGRREFSKAYTPSARGKLQILCYVKGEDGAVLGPAIFTLTGTVTKEMGQIVKDHRSTVNRATGNTVPAPYFFVTVVAGAQVRRGAGNESSMGTPVVLPDGYEFNPDEDYVGDETADDIEARWSEFKEWAESPLFQEDGGQPVEQESQQDGDEQRQQPRSAPQRPQEQRNVTPAVGDMVSARNAWSAAWNALKRQGVRLPLLNNSWGVTEIKESTARMNAAIKQLQDGATPDEVMESF